MLVKLKDIAFVVGGATPSTANPDYYNGNIIWITPKDLAQNKGSKYIYKGERNISELGFSKSNTYKIPANNILISTRAPIGYIAINKVECCTNQGFKTLICDNKKVNVDFLYYLLNTKMKSIENLGTGTTFKEVSKESIENFEINLPSLEEQNKIAKILSNIDDQIERNNAMVKRLQDFGNTIYSKTFSSENKMISLLTFPYIKLIPPGINKFNSEKRYIATADVTEKNINYKADFITYNNRENRANMQPVYNSVWFAKMKDSIKHIFIPNIDNILVSNYIFSTGFIGFSCEDIAFEYLVNYISSKYFEDMKNRLCHGATMQSINNEDLKSMKIILPEKSKLIEFHNRTNEIYKKISKIQEINISLTTLKTNLLPLLINGQLQ